MKVNIKKLHIDAVMPGYAKAGDAGMDLTAISRVIVSDDKEGDYIEYGTGLAIEIPEGHVGLVFPRSSVSKKDVFLANSVGVIDSGYRGEIKLRFKMEQMYDSLDSWDNEVVYFINEEKKFYSNVYGVGDKVGQLIIIPYPHIDLVEADELSDSTRGEGGFGSTGK